MCIRECINIGNLFVTDSVRAPAAKPTELGQRGSSYQSFLSTSAKIRTSSIRHRVETPFSRAGLAKRAQGLESANGSGFGFSTFREPTIHVSLENSTTALARAIAITLITRGERKDHSHLRGADLMELRLGWSWCSRYVETGDTRPRLEASRSVDLIILSC